MPEPIDVVVTWVDDAWPGYRALVQRHAQRPVDTNPNRTRDNLAMLKYNLRSLARFMPWHRRVILVTARPQLPAWLDPSAENLRVVHHDAIFAPADLPCFNSFAIVAHLVNIPGLSERFLYMEDDRFLASFLQPEHLFAPCGRPWLYATGAWTDRGRAHPSPRQNPWNAALAYSNHLLDATHGAVRRRSIKHAPPVFDVQHLRRFVRRFAEPVGRTRASRFRAPGNIALEHMAPYDMWHRGEARMLPRQEAERMALYHGTDNFLWRQRLGLRRLRRADARFWCINDNFGARPRPACVRAVQELLQSSFPQPSPFERRDAEVRAG